MENSNHMIIKVYFRHDLNCFMNKDYIGNPKEEIRMIECGQECYKG